MNAVIRNYLYNHNILVSENTTKTVSDETCQSLFTLCNRFSILINKGIELCDKYVLGSVLEAEGCCVPDSFYRGFPQSVRHLSNEEMIINRILHYYHTYGLGEFNEAGHSAFEETIQRDALNEDCEPRYFDILTIEEANEKAKEYFYALMNSTRPLNDGQYLFVLNAISDYNISYAPIASKNTAIRLIVDCKNIPNTFARNLTLPDTLKVAEYIVDIHNKSRSRYLANPNGKETLTNLQFNSSERKFISKLLDTLFEAIEDKKTLVWKKEIKSCYERKKVWCGLLHHIHYKPKTEHATKFVNGIRSNEKKSVLSLTEKYMQANKPSSAAFIMNDYKGASYVLRNLNYLLSRCKSLTEVDEVLKYLDGNISPIALMQLIQKYSVAETAGRRTFSFAHSGMVKRHTETVTESEHRKSYIDEWIRQPVYEKLVAMYKNHFSKMNLSKVYIDKKMDSVALPIYNSTSACGQGVLPTGTRIQLDTSKTMRLFTYWEKVNDIDLSILAVDENFNITREFSWRSGCNSPYAVFSGDQTSGYNGGSEYFDINLEACRNDNPNARYLVLSDNVYSGSTFDRCYCTAGYMVRENPNSGEVYEPKTVKTSFTINCPSTFAVLFLVDLKTMELVWCNASIDSCEHVAGESHWSFLRKYTDIPEMFRYGYLFSLMANEVVTTPDEADIIVSDEPILTDKKVIHSYDVETVMEYINMR